MWYVYHEIRNPSEIYASQITLYRTIWYLDRHTTFLFRKVRDILHFNWVFNDFSFRHLRLGNAILSFKWWNEKAFYSLQQISPLKLNFSTTRSCVSLTRSTTSSEWKLFRFDKISSTILISGYLMSRFVFDMFKAVLLKNEKRKKYNRHRD